MPEYLNTPPEARHCQREKTEKMKGRTREKEIMIKHLKIPKETSLKANQDPRIRTDGLTETYGPR